MNTRSCPPLTLFFQQRQHHLPSFHPFLSIPLHLTLFTTGIINFPSCTPAVNPVCLSALGFSAEIKKKAIRAGRKAGRAALEAIMMVLASRKAATSSYIGVSCCRGASRSKWRLSRSRVGAILREVEGHQPRISLSGESGLVFATTPIKNKKKKEKKKTR